MVDRDQKIRERAYALWESEGRGEGGHLDHWHRAEVEHDATERQAIEAEKTNKKAAEEVIEDGERPAPAGPDVRPPSMMSPD
jgi:hypothetical protein